MIDDDVDEQRLRKLRDDARTLPRSIEPPPDAWLGIRARIEAEGKPGAPSAALPDSRITFWQRPAFLAAAAMLLVIGSSALTAVAMRKGGLGVRQASVAEQRPEIAGRAPAPTSSGPGSLAQFTLVESDYLRAVNELSATLDSERGSLSPETIAKLRESLKIIDGAILEARNALAADPANRTLIQMLSASYDQKVDLLKRTTEMARS